MSTQQEMTVCRILWDLLSRNNVISFKGEFSCFFGGDLNAKKKEIEDVRLIFKN